jgi:hypothetical protein
MACGPSSGSFTQKSLKNQANFFALSFWRGLACSQMTEPECSLETEAK